MMVTTKTTMRASKQSRCCELLITVQDNYTIIFHWALDNWFCSFCLYLIFHRRYNWLLRTETIRSLKQHTWSEKILISVGIINFWSWVEERRLHMKKNGVYVKIKLMKKRYFIFRYLHDIQWIATSVSQRTIHTNYVAMEMECFCNVNNNVQNLHFIYKSLSYWSYIVDDELLLLSFFFSSVLWRHTLCCGEGGEKVAGTIVV